jgi:hypothetical protein
LEPALVKEPVVPDALEKPFADAAAARGEQVIPFHALAEDGSVVKEAEILFGEWHGRLLRNFGFSILD